MPEGGAVTAGKYGDVEVCSFYPPCEVCLRLDRVITVASAAGSASSQLSVSENTFKYSTEHKASACKIYNPLTWRGSQ